MMTKAVENIAASFVSVNEAATLIGVSTATVRNWIKTGLLSDSAHQKGSISKQEVEVLLSRIKNGDINRLQNRANKSISQKKIIPSEYISQDLSEVAYSILEICENERITSSEAMLYVAVSYLINCEEILGCDYNENRVQLAFKRDGIKKIILDWKDELCCEIDVAIIDEMCLILSNYCIDEQSDFLGVIYQSLSREGEKSEKGSYYTPNEIVDDIIKDYYKPGMKFLDPCCGTGQFLMSCVKLNECKLEDLYGIDIDTVAVKIASLNLLMSFPEEDVTPNLYSFDTITDIDFESIFCEHRWLQNKFDLIATNPPWGATLNKKLLASMYPEIMSGESFSYFIVRCYDFLKENGIFSLVLPKSILNIAAHRDIRRFIATNYTIRTIVELGRAFSGVYTKAYRIDLQKSRPLQDHLVLVKNEAGTYEQKQSMYYKNKHYMFNVYQQNESQEIIEKIYSFKHITLKGRADWALGIVTGNNQKYLSDTHKDGHEPIFRGKDVFPMRLGKPQKYIRFMPELYQQIAPEWKYRVNEKLVYRFISKRLVFAYDDKQMLTLNSANICIPEDFGMKMQTICALMNTDTYNFIYTSRFNTHKVLRSNLEELPIPIDFIDEDNEVNKVSTLFVNGLVTLDVLDDILMKYFNLTEKEKDIIRKLKGIEGLTNVYMIENIDNTGYEFATTNGHK